MQSQVRFNRVPEKVPEKAPGSLGEKPSQVQRVPEKVAETKPGQFHLTYGNPAEVFPALGFAARFREICKNKTLRLLGIPPKLIFLKWVLYVFAAMALRLCTRRLLLGKCVAERKLDRSSTSEKGHLGWKDGNGWKM